MIFKAGVMSWFGFYAFDLLDHALVVMCVCVCVYVSRNMLFVESCLR